MFSFLANFLNPALLGGVAAGSIPIIIHLLNRQRFKHVVWAAMHWLWASYKKSRRRLQIEQLLLLLIRTLVVVLLAMALARPALQAGAGLLSGGAPRQRVIVLDNSFSMGRLVAGKPLYDKAKLTAAELVKQLSAADDVAVLLANSSIEELTPGHAISRNEVVNLIMNAPLSDGGTDIPRAIAAACARLNEHPSANSRREIIVVTDQTRAGWERPDHKPRQVLGDGAAALTAAFQNTRNKPRIVVLRLLGDKDTDNLAATGLEVDEKVVPTHVETELIGTVTSFAASTATNVKVKLRVDNEEVASEVIGSLAPHASATVSFRHVFPEAGSHAVAIELEPDNLPADNTAYLALDVEDQMHVLCVDGQQRTGANASEMDYFRQALAPTRAEEVKAGKMPLFPEVVSDAALPQIALEPYRLVVLANVAVLPPEKIAALEQYVKRGGSLWIFAGDRVDATVYNTQLRNLLPMALGELIGSGDPDGPAEELSDQDLGHPAIAKFKGIRGLPLAQLHTFRRFRLVPFPQNDPTVRTVLAYANGDVAAVEKTLGEGHVLLIGTSANKAWNNWPEKNHYMPLMNFLALYLIQPSYIQRNRMLGERFVLQLPRADLGTARREGIRLIEPNGDAGAMEVQTETARAESRPIKRAGIYSAEIPGDGKRLIYFAANRPVEESDLEPIDDKEILAFIPSSHDAANPEQAGYFGASVTQDNFQLAGEDLKEVDENLKHNAGSRELWRYLAGTVLVLLLLESVLALRFGRFRG